MHGARQQFFTPQRGDGLTGANQRIAGEVLKPHLHEGSGRISRSSAHHACGKRINLTIADHGRIFTGRRGGPDLHLRAGSTGGKSRFPAIGADFVVRQFVLGFRHPSRPFLGQVVRGADSGNERGAVVLLLLDVFGHAALLRLSHARVGVGGVAG